MTTTHNDLIAKLEAKRKSLGLTHSAFAQLLGARYVDWAQMRAGKRTLTLGQADLVKDKWPELTTPVIEYLFQKGRNQREKKKRAA